MSATRSACCGTSTDREPAGRRSARSGFTLVELLWAMALSLVVMAALASLFGLFGRSLTDAQAAADLAGRLRSAAWRLRQDLSGVTVDLMPPVRPESESGYFEYFEGWRKDAHAFPEETGQALIADVDDVLMFTTRSEGQPFVGRLGAGTIESPVAEVAWFCRPSTVQPVAGMTMFTLYRRQELVMPYVGLAPFDSGNSAATFDTNLNDLSVRLEEGRFIPNSLGDLTKRENRFLRGGITTFPHAWARDEVVWSGTFTGTYQLAGPEAPLVATRAGEDVVLSNVLSFDVRVFDPNVQSPVNSVVQLMCTSTMGSQTVNLNLLNPGTTTRRASIDPVIAEPSPRSYGGLIVKAGAIVRRSSAFPTGAKLGRELSEQFQITVDTAAATTGTTLLEIETGSSIVGDGRYFGATNGNGFRGGYVDVGWGGYFRAKEMWYQQGLFRKSPTDKPVVDRDQSQFIPPIPQAVGEAFPPAGETAFRTGGVRAANRAAGTLLDTGSSRTFDTWSTHYEANGIDEDGDGIVDDGTNGLDDNGDGVPDDPAEAETSPPYPTRLRGIEVRLRCYDPDSGQIRQTTLRHTFLAR